MLSIAIFGIVKKLIVSLFFVLALVVNSKLFIEYSDVNSIAGLVGVLFFGKLVANNIVKIKYEVLNIIPKLRWK